MAAAKIALKDAVNSLVNTPALRLSLTGPASVCALLTSRRLSVGITYDDLSATTGISQRRLVLLFQTRGKAADGRRWAGLGLSNFLKLCDALGVQPLLAADKHALKSRRPAEK